MEDRQCRSPTLLQVKEREGEREREPKPDSDGSFFSTIDWQRPISISIETESE